MGLSRLIQRPQLLLALLAAIFGASYHSVPHSFAKTGGAQTSISSEYESYLSRPDILKVTAKAHPELGLAWKALKRAHLEAIALLLEMYPDREIYFLARDAELLYDLAKHVTRDDPSQTNRMHLLNISRANMTSKHLPEYLAQEGISKATLRSGKRVLFVDTGFSGTIPSVIAEQFPEDLRSNLKTHLMVSSNPDHPSTRVFLSAVNPLAATGMPARNLHGSIISYEHLPRYTDRSTGFQYLDGKWQPVSPKNHASDGTVSREKSLAYQEDLLAYAQDTETRDLLSDRRAAWKKLHGLEKKPTELIQELKRMAAQGGYQEAMVRDFLNMRGTTIPLPKPSKKNPIITTQTLGIMDSDIPLENQKQFLKKKYPSWKPILQNPETHIPKALKTGDYATLGAIADVLDDLEFKLVLVRSIGKSPPSKVITDFSKMLVEKDVTYARLFSNSAIDSSNCVAFRELIEFIIEKAPDKVVYENLIDRVFSRLPSGELNDLLLKLIQRTPQIHSSFVEKKALTLLSEKRFSKIREKGVSLYLEALAAFGEKYAPLCEEPFKALSGKLAP